MRNLQLVPKWVWFSCLVCGISLLSFSTLCLFVLDNDWKVPFGFLSFISAVMVLSIPLPPIKKWAFGFLLVLGSILGTYPGILFSAKITSEKISQEMINSAVFYESIYPLIAKNQCDSALLFLEKDLKMLGLLNGDPSTFIVREKIWKDLAVHGCITGEKLEQSLSMLSLINK